MDLTASHFFWLCGVGLVQYYEQLTDNGFETLNDLFDLIPADFKDVIPMSQVCYQCRYSVNAHGLYILCLLSGAVRPFLCKCASVEKHGHRRFCTRAQDPPAECGWRQPNPGPRG